jgi:integrase
MEKVSGIKFKFKDYRSSFTQIHIDNEEQVQAVSKVLGHGSTKTTEKRYGRIRNSAAMKEIQEKSYGKIGWTAKPNNAEKPRIKSETEITGYL